MFLAFIINQVCTQAALIHKTFISAYIASLQQVLFFTKRSSLEVGGKSLRFFGCQGDMTRQVF